MALNVIAQRAAWLSVVHLDGSVKAVDRRTENYLQTVVLPTQYKRGMSLLPLALAEQADAELTRLSAAREAAGGQPYRWHLQAIELPKLPPLLYATETAKLGAVLDLDAVAIERWLHLGLASRIVALTSSLESGGARTITAAVARLNSFLQTADARNIIGDMKFAKAVGLAGEALARVDLKAPQHWPAVRAALLDAIPHQLAA